MHNFDLWAAEVVACSIPPDFVYICQSTFSCLKNFPQISGCYTASWFLIHLLHLEKDGAIMCDLSQLDIELASWLDYTIPQQQQIYTDLLHHYKKIWDCPGFISTEVQENTPLIQVGDRFVYLRKNYLLEQHFWQIFSQGFFPHAHTDNLGLSLYPQDDWQAVLKEFLPAGQQPQPSLLEAVQTIHNTNLLILTGGPGTGKTWMLSIILRSLIHKARKTRPQDPLKIVLAAPTGRAQARMLESLNQSIGSQTLQDFPEIPAEGKTLHTLLGYIPHTLKQPDPDWLYADVLVVDEASMLDLTLFTRLFQSIPAKTKLILLGDPDQLPSVELGAVFSDMLLHYHQQGKPHLLQEHIVKLTKIHRAENPEIVQLAQAALDADFSLFQSYLTPWTNREILQNGVSIFNLADIPLSSVITWLRQQYHMEETTLHLPFHQRPQSLSTQELARLQTIFRNFNSLCILSARRDKHPLSVKELNKALAKVSTDLQPFHGMPIIVEKNIEEYQLTNGERGVVLQMDGQLLCCFQKSGGTDWLTVPVNILWGYISPSYVMTIHKSQGSEFDHVYMILPDHCDVLMTRSLLFTGITRAKKKVVLFTSLSTLENSLYTQNPGISCLAYLFAQQDPAKQRLPQKKLSADTQLSLFD